MTDEIREMFLSFLPKQKEETNMIYFWKIVFCYLLIRYHVYWDDRWYLGAEFFFIVSGYLLAKDFFNNHDTPLNYLKKRLIKLYPYFIISFVVALLLKERPFNIDNVLQHYKEFLLIHGWGFFGSNDPEWYNGPDWYLSALLGAGYIIYFLLGKLKSEYVRFYAPVSSILLFGYNYINYAGINSFGFPFGGHIPRALASMNLGVVAYGIASNINCERLTVIKKYVMLLFSTLFFLAGIYLSYDIEKGSLDFLCVLLFFAGITLAFSVPVSSKVINNRVIHHLSELTLPIYLNHYFLKPFNPGSHVLFIVMLLFIADMEVLVIKICGKYISQMIHKNEIPRGN